MIDIEHSLHGTMTSFISFTHDDNDTYIHMRKYNKFNTLYYKNCTKHIATRWRRHTNLILNQRKNSLIKLYQIVLGDSLSEGISKVVFDSNISQIKNIFIY